MTMRIGRGLRRRAALERAVPFAQLSNRAGVQQWMLWDGWCLHVGCDVCADHGPAAPCWGHSGCHGWIEGCGCTRCATRQVRELAALDHVPPATAAARLTTGPGVAARLGPTHGRT